MNASPGGVHWILREDDISLDSDNQINISRLICVLVMYVVYTYIHTQHFMFRGTISGSERSVLPIEL